MHGLQVVAALGVALLLVSILSHRTSLPFPVLLLIGGVALGTVPVLRNTPLPPEVVLVLFLPALLYWESLTTSLREIRRNIRVILLNGVLLVAMTAVAVAAVAHALGLPWAAAFVLGAAVAPTDATAVASVARRLPRRQQTILRAESLINDGAALVLYAVAVEVATGADEPGGWEITGRVALAYGVGALAGGATAWTTAYARRLAHKPLLENVVNVLTPFVAYLVAEQLHGSGVIGVVVAGLVLSQIGPRRVSAVTRLQGRAFWQLATFLLNGALFLLVGLQVYSVVSDLGRQSFMIALRDAAIVLGVVMGTRLVSAYTLVYVIRAIDPRPAQRLMRVSSRHRLVTAWAGPRGAISLAAALAVPTTLHDGAPFAERSSIVFTTFVVIVGTLVIQGMTLDRVVEWSQLPEDTAQQDEIQLAEKQMAEAAHAALAGEARRLDSPPEVVDRLQRMYDDRHRDDAEQFRDLRLALLAVKRAELVRLRDAREIDDIVLRRIQTRLDREESSLRPDLDVE